MQTNLKGNAIIFSDLDGTLLHEKNYAFNDALPALDFIDIWDIPLILCSSKTRAEIETYRLRLYNLHPFISENGGGIFIPQGYFPLPIRANSFAGYQCVILGMRYAEVRRHFVALRERLGTRVRGFGDMTVEEVVTLTGLSYDEAQLSMQRDFDEPFVFEGAEDEKFLQAIVASGLRWTRGRLFHIMGNHDKGSAVNFLISIYRQQYGEVESMGLGDSLNDLEMLRAVNYPVLVSHEDGSFDDGIKMSGLLRTNLSGPAGWSDSVLQLLDGEVDENFTALLVQQNLQDIFYAALKAVEPCGAVHKAVHLDHNRLSVVGRCYDLSQFKRIFVIGAGKASAPMALAIEDLLGSKISNGLIIVKEGHTVALQHIEQVEASHPVPNEAGLTGTHRILQLMGTADKNTLVICLLSGGASALLVSPAEGLTLQDKQHTTGLLLKAGASINELNTVRKHLSSVKGGRLAQAVLPAQLVTLILSDVIGDPLDVIASGPTVPDSSTYLEAWSVIVKYGLTSVLPQRVIDFLQKGVNGEITETPKADAVTSGKVHNLIISNINQALEAAKIHAEDIGYKIIQLPATLHGEARKAACMLTYIARTELIKMKPGEKLCLLCGGETTVTVKGNGKGGRNQELALAFALEIEGMRGISLLSAGTDGSDGPTDAGGAIVDGKTIIQARKLGLNPNQFLDNNDSYTFFQFLDSMLGGHSHIKTGPTGTNVMDIQIILLESKE